jgi:arylsulfatase A-like enzyme
MKPNLLANLLVLACCLAAPLAAQSKPNIIFILCDDLGYGDIGIFQQNARAAAGLPAFHTPHIDAMAAQGAVLSRHYCPAPVCAPSRASLLLGVHQGHSNVRDNQFDKLLDNNHTLGSVLRQAGYATAAIGKWGLQGGPEKAGTPASPSFPTKRGFDFFFGYLDHSACHRHYPKENPADAGDPDGANTVWEMNTNITSQLDKCYSTDLFAARAKEWIIDHRAATPATPFFLYLSFTAPHAALQVPTQAYPAGGGLAGGLQWSGTPGTMINTSSGTIDSWIHPDYASKPGWSNANKRHATMVRRLDDSVGDLLQLLADLHIGNDTLVVFTSDNGPHYEGSYTGIVQDPRFFRSYGGMDGIKRDTWEAGIRMPTLVRWPAAIPAGRVSAHASQFHDWLPTFTEVAGLPAPARSDGVSLVPALTGSGTQREGLVYVEYSTSGSTPTFTDFETAHRGASWNQQQVIHLGDYKGIRHNTTSHAVDFKIYNTATDPKETNNLANQAGVPSQQEFHNAVLRVRRPNGTTPRAYDNEPVPSLPLVAGRPGAAWRAFESPFLWVPDFTGISPAASGETTRPDISVRTRNDDIGVEFSGYLRVPTTGDYTFYLTADTGAFLRLHRMQVLDADFGYTGGSEISSTVKLQAGLHPYTLGYRRGTGGTPSLGLSWAGPSLAKQVIPAAAFAVTAVATTDALSHWPLDEGSGTTTSEVRTATVSDSFGAGIAWSGDAPVSGASLAFGGSSGIGTNLDSAATGINGSGAKTISAWIKTGTTSDRAFFGYSPTAGSTPGADLRLLVNAAGQLRFEANSGNFALSSATVNDGVWHFIAAVIPAGTTTAGISFYIDGLLTSPGTAGGTATLNTASGSEIWIGTDGNTGRHFSGLIDHVRIHDRVLNLIELNALRDAKPGAGFASWIDSFFPGASDPLVIGFECDPDGDGVANGLEYYLGGDNNPSLAGPVPMPSATVSDGNLVFTFTRRDGAGSPDLTVMVQSGPDLASWPETYAIGPDNASSSPGVSIQENGTGDDTITVTIPLDGGTRRFVRLALAHSP